MILANAPWIQSAVEEEIHYALLEHLAPKTSSDWRGLERRHRGGAQKASNGRADRLC